jgi:hypothetical protein
MTSIATNSSTATTGSETASLCRRVRPIRNATSISSHSTASSTIGFASGIRYRANGGTSPRTVVFTITDAVPLPDGNEFGFTLQEVAVAFVGIVHVNATAAENPFCAATLIAFANVAVVPAGTVTLVVPTEVIEKSGGPVTVKFIGTEVPPGGGSTT